MLSPAQRRRLARLPAASSNGRLRMAVELYYTPHRWLPVVDHAGFGNATTVLYFQEFFEIVQSVTGHHIVLDFQATRSSTSTHEGTLVNISAYLDNSGGALWICSVHPRLQVVFDMLGLDAVLHIAEDRAGALAHLGLQPHPTDAALAALLDRIPQDPDALSVALDYLAERDDPRATTWRAFLDAPDLAFTHCRRGPVRDPDPPRVRLVLPLGAGIEACFVPAI